MSGPSSNVQASQGLGPWPQAFPAWPSCLRARGTWSLILNLWRGVELDPGEGVFQARKDIHRKVSGSPAGLHHIAHDSGEQGWPWQSRRGEIVPNLDCFVKLPEEIHPALSSWICGTSSKMGDGKGVPSTWSCLDRCHPAPQEREQKDCWLVWRAQRWQGTPMLPVLLRLL